MSKTSHRLAVLAVAAAGLFSVTTAQACGWTYCSQPAPAYRYAVRPRPYVVAPLPALTQLVPNVFLIDRHRWYRNYPYVNCGYGCTNTYYYYPNYGAAPVRRGLIGKVRTRGHVVHKANKPRREETRVIRANAEVTIIGPDRMTIRLYRKGRGSKKH